MNSLHISEYSQLRVQTQSQLQIELWVVGDNDARMILAFRFPSYHIFNFIAV